MDETKRSRREAVNIHGYIYVSCNRCSSNNVCCAAIIIVRSNVYIVSFFIVMGILILTNRTTTYLLQRCFSTRHQRTSRQTREILVYTVRKSEREGESTNERVYDCGEGPDGVSESIFGYCCSRCGRRYAVQYSLDRHQKYECVE